MSLADLPLTKKLSNSPNTSSHLVFSKAEILNKLEQVFVFIALILLSDAFVPLFRREFGGLDRFSAGGDPYQRAMFFGIYAISFLFILLRIKTFVRSLVDNKWLVLLTLFVLLSYFWSFNPAITLRRAIAIGLTTSFGIYFGSRYDLRQQMNFLITILMLLVVSSLIFGLFLPQLGVMQTFGTAGNWRGVFIHKNVLGRAAGLLIILLSLNLRYPKRSRVYYLIGIALCGLALFLSKSTNSLIITACVLATTPILRSVRYRKFLSRFWHILFFTLLFGMSYFVYQYSGEILVLFGKNEDLTGRAELWPLIFDIIQKRPLLGYGFGAYWHKSTGLVQNLLLSLTWEMNHAHNGFLDVSLDLGWVGLSLYLVVFFTASLNAYRAARLHSKSAYGYWPLAFLLFVFLNNIAESMILNANSIYWVLFSAACVTTSRTVAQNRKINPK